MTATQPSTISNSTDDTGPVHVVVIGGGFGGLEAVKGLRELQTDRDLFITLIDQRNHHTFQPLLYQVATAGLAAGNVGQGLRRLYGTPNTAFGRWRQRHRNPVQVVMGEVMQIDKDRRRVTLNDGRQIPYTHLIAAGGCVTNDFGLPGVNEHGWRLKSLQQATQLRDHLIRQFEFAAADPDRVSDGTLTFVIAGGGPTGVEMAGAIAELSLKVMDRDHPTFEVEHVVKVMILEMGDRLLAPFAPELSAKTKEALESLGVDVRLGVALAEAHEDHVVLTDGTVVPTRTLVWVAGVKPGNLAQVLDGELMRGGRVKVTEHLQLPGHPNVFVIGDMAGAPTDEELLPQVAPVAMQGADHVVEVIKAQVAGRSPSGPFTYKDKGSMATIGRNHAIAQLPNGMKLSGVLGWIAWLALHLLTLIGFGNRLAVLSTWIHNWFTSDRLSRIIVNPPPEGSIDARVAAEPVYPIGASSPDPSAAALDAPDEESPVDDPEGDDHANDAPEASAGSEPDEADATDD